MTILYPIEGQLYINLTNQCSCACTFCIRQKGDGVYGSDNLWLERDVTAEEVITALKDQDLSQYKSIVFCGYGEPLMKLDEVVSICQALRAYTTLPIRINTNGLANLTYGKDVPSVLEGLVDQISISLNAANEEIYEAICRPRYGKESHKSLLAFAKSCKVHIPEVQFSIVEGTISEEEVVACQELAREMGIPFRIRERV
ncbi:MAG: TIGR04100 family radical SAM protein [Cellulosilyticaceae bacterium]